MLAPDEYKFYSCENSTLKTHMFYTVLRTVFRENYGYSNEYQSVDIKVLLHQNIQCIKNNYNMLAQAPDTQYVGYVYMIMSRTKITYNQFYNC